MRECPWIQYVFVFGSKQYGFENVSARSQDARVLTPVQNDRPRRLAISYQMRGGGGHPQACYFELSSLISGQKVHKAFNFLVVECFFIILIRWHQ